MKIKPFIPFILGIIITFILCHMPGKDLPNVSVWGLDKVVHFTLFFLLSLLFFKASIKNNTNLKLQYILFWLFILISYGGLLELYQGYFVQDRTADVFDFVANGLGTIAGFFILKIKI